VREEGGNILLVIAIVDRLEGAAETFANEKLPFRALYTADEFLKS
jgi:orotate phosphoribosyltransferase